jgi:hypothetical protein
MAKKTKAPKQNPYKKFEEDLMLRQLMYEKYGLADRNEGGMPLGEPSFFGKGTRRLDIDDANFQLWKQRMQETGGLGFFGASEPAPKSVAIERAFESQKAMPSNPWFFGVPPRR